MCADGLQARYQNDAKYSSQRNGAQSTQRKPVATDADGKGRTRFTAAKGGLMYDASVGGQKFGYETL